MDLCSMRWVQTLWPKHLPLLAEFGVSYEYTLHSGWSCPERWFAWGRKSGIVRGKWWYELWDMNYMNKGRFFLRNYKPTNQRIRFSQAKKHETTSTWINRKNKQKKHELNDGAVFHFQTVRFQWEVQRLLELKMDPNETCEPHGTSAVHQVGGGCFTGGSVMIPLMSVFSCRKKVKWFSLTSKPGSYRWSLWSLATSSKLWCCSLAENRGGRWVGSLWSRCKWRMKSSLKITI